MPGSAAGAYRGRRLPDGALAPSPQHPRPRPAARAYYFFALTGQCLLIEYFHGDNGAGIGASHQTGWTGLIARLLDTFGRIDAKDLELDLGRLSAQLVREQVGGEKTGGH
jgi:hypothetical protein